MAPCSKNRTDPTSRTRRTTRKAATTQGATLRASKETKTTGRVQLPISQRLMRRTTKTQRGTTSTRRSRQATSSAERFQRKSNCARTLKRSVSGGAARVKSTSMKRTNLTPCSRRRSSRRKRLGREERSLVPHSRLRGLKWPHSSQVRRHSTRSTKKCRRTSRTKSLIWRQSSRKSCGRPCCATRFSRKPQPSKTCRRCSRSTRW